VASYIVVSSSPAWLFDGLPDDMSFGSGLLELDIDNLLSEPSGNYTPRSKYACCSLRKSGIDSVTQYGRKFLT
jgi:hypothetical protein